MTVWAGSAAIVCNGNIGQTIISGTSSTGATQPVLGGPASIIIPPSVGITVPNLTCTDTNQPQAGDCAGGVDCVSGLINVTNTTSTITWYSTGADGTISSLGFTDLFNNCVTIFQTATYTASTTTGTDTFEFYLTNQIGDNNALDIPVTIAAQTPATQIMQATCTIGGKATISAIAQSGQFGSAHIAGVATVTATSLGNQIAASAHIAAYVTIGSDPWSSAFSGAFGPADTIPTTVIGLVTSIVGSGAVVIAEPVVLAAALDTISGIATVSANASNAVQFAAATIAGAASVTVQPAMRALASDTIACTGSVSATAQSGQFDSAALAGVATLTINTHLLIAATDTIAGAATLSAATTIKAQTTDTIAGAGTVIESDTQLLRATDTIAGAASVATTAMLVAAATATIPGAAQITGITQDYLAASATINGVATPAFNANLSGNVYQGAATIAGVSTVTEADNQLLAAVAAINGAALATGAATHTPTASLTIAGAAAVTATATMDAAAIVAPSGVATVVAAALQDAAATQHVSGVAAITESDNQLLAAAATIGGAGAVSANAIRTPSASLIVNGQASVLATATVVAAVLSTINGNAVCGATAGQVLSNNTATIAGSGLVVGNAITAHLSNAAFAGQAALQVSVVVEQAALITAAGAATISANAVPVNIVPNVFCTGSANVTLNSTIIYHWPLPYPPFSVSPMTPIVVEEQSPAP